MTEKTTSRSTIVAVVLGAGVVALLVAAVLFGGGIGGTAVPVEEELGSPQVEGALPPMPRETNVDSSATGLPAPVVVGNDYDGNTVTIENDGRPKAVVFLAHWCPHCQNEVPSVQRWLNDTGGVEGVDLYSVSTALNAQPGNYPPSEWLEEEGWTVPLIRDDARSSVLVAHGDGGFPFWVFTNSDGTVALRVAGEIPIADLEGILRGLT
jgi:thiol-disulfide isomerase/thioredoxin